MSKKYNWTNWPKTQGSQYVCLGTKMWVAEVRIDMEKFSNKVWRVIIWKGSSYYILRPETGNKGFRFKQMEWPEFPK